MTTKTQTKKPKTVVLTQKTLQSMINKNPPPLRVPRRRKRSRNMNNNINYTTKTTYKQIPSTFSSFTQNSKVLTVNISHRELVTAVDGSIAFNLDSFGVNPGRASVFPWLSGVALSFEEYRFRKLEFHYVNSCGTTTTGSVALAFCYDPDNQDATSMTEVNNISPSIISSAYSPVCLKVPVNRLNQTLHYVRYAAEVDDLKEYDIGSLFVVSEGQAGAGIIGNVFVDYTVELVRPTTNHEILNTYSSYGRNNPTSAKAVQTVPSFSNVNEKAPYKIESDNDGLIFVFNQIGHYLINSNSYSNSLSGTKKLGLHFLGQSYATLEDALLNQIRRYLDPTASTTNGWTPTVIGLIVNHAPARLVWAATHANYNVNDLLQVFHIDARRIPFLNHISNIYGDEKRVDKKTSKDDKLLKDKEDY